MGSVGNQNPWPPYNTNIDCSQGICTIYCPQFCYFFFPPPPASRSDDSTPLSPLVMALIGVIASAFLLVSYYTVVTRYCRRRSGRDAVAEHEDNEVGQAARDQWRAASGGLDESVIKTIKVRKYRRDDELIEGTDCAVCLSEFREDETLRLLPKCGHAFHVPCIDTWLRSQSNCPLCRALIAPNANPVEGQRAAIIDFVAVAVDDDDGHRQDGDVCGEQAVLRSSNHDDNGNENAEGNEDGVVKRLRRSMSLGTFTSRRHFSIPDVVGTSKGDVMKRSVSSGGLMFAVHGRGKNCSVLPN